MPSAMVDPQIEVERISKARISAEEAKKQLDALSPRRTLMDEIIRTIMFVRFPSLRTRL
jgi:hypothetical protein